ncbi:hypothetical protein BRAS3843_1730007 [Bradyrhizobium sp. STM 3843]|nr:hypothetical protein BRAS3843_1730007 [Bradyrhizobium sp. STM 3843]
MSLISRTDGVVCALVISRVPAIFDHVLSLVEMPAWRTHMLSSSHHSGIAGASGSWRSIPRAGCDGQVLSVGRSKSSEAVPDQQQTDS